MMRTRTLFLIPFFLALVGLASLAGARPPFGGGGPFGPPHGRHEARFLERYGERLGIDDETRERIELRFEASSEQAQPLRDELEDAHRALRELLHAAEPDREAVLAQADRIGVLETQLRRLRLSTLLEVRGLLSDEQRAEMVAIHEERTRSRLEPMLEACTDDLDAHCPDAEHPHALFRCLREHRDELSESCRGSLGSWKRGPRHPDCR